MTAGAIQPGPDGTHVAEAVTRPSTEPGAGAPGNVMDLSVLA